MVSVRDLLVLGFVTRCRCLRLLDGVAKNIACSSLSMYLRAVVTSVGLIVDGVRGVGVVVVATFEEPGLFGIMDYGLSV